MSNYQRRLHHLEADIGLDEPTDALEAWVYRLCEGRAILTAIKRMAEVRATRRAKLEDRFPVSTVRPPEFGEWVQVELAGLDRRLAETGEFFAGIAAWSDEPDLLGWPPEYGHGTSQAETGAALFWHWVGLSRTRADQQRSADVAGSTRWRADNPDWSRDMTDQEFLAFDLAPLMADREALPDGR